MYQSRRSGFYSRNYSGTVWERIPRNGTEDPLGGNSGALSLGPWISEPYKVITVLVNVTTVVITVL